MKVISIIQPWATLIAIGEKNFETRSWSTKYRGPIAIHASKKIDKTVCKSEPFRSVLEAYGYTEKELPTGMIIATAHLTECFKVEKDCGDYAVITDGFIAGNEYKFGDYTPGRFAWLLVRRKLLENPIPAKGQLGLWEHQLTGN
jgi:hypothetical protein